MLILKNKSSPASTKAETKKKKVSKREIIERLRADGDIELKRCFSQLGFIIKFHGALAKLPSTTNNRLITVPRQHVIKKIYSGASPSDLVASVKALRGYLTKSEEQAARLQVMTEKWKELESSASVPVSKEKRGLVLILLGPACDRSDTHNMPKAVCDWLQEVGVICNDRYVDVFARRKSDCGLNETSSDVGIFEYDFIHDSNVNRLFDGLMTPTVYG